MEPSLRDEIILLSCIYCFCLVSIPLTILACYPEKVFDKSSINHHGSTAEWRKRLYIDSIQFLDELNEKNGGNDDLGFSYLMNLSREDFNRSGMNLSVDGLQTLEKSVWRKFKMNNGTVLGPKSVKLPLRVDW